MTVLQQQGNDSPATTRQRQSYNNKVTTAMQQGNYSPATTRSSAQIYTCDVTGISGEAPLETMEHIRQPACLPSQTTKVRLPYGASHNKATSHPFFCRGWAYICGGKGSPTLVGRKKHFKLSI